MSDIIEPTEQSELASLKARADLAGVKYHPNIGVDALREKLNAKLGYTDEFDSSKAEDSVVTPTKSLQQYLQETELALVRIRVSCNNPSKKDLQGEWFTVDNRYIGTIRKFVPFGEAMDKGYHVPKCIYTVLKEREYLRVTTRKDNKGNTVMDSRYVPEYSIEVLPPLTEQELKDLAKLQLATGSVD